MVEIEIKETDASGAVRLFYRDRIMSLTPRNLARIVRVFNGYPADEPPVIEKKGEEA